MLVVRLHRSCWVWSSGCGCSSGCGAAGMYRSANRSPLTDVLPFWFLWIYTHKAYFKKISSVICFLQSNPERWNAKRHLDAAVGFMKGEWMWKFVEENFCLKNSTFLFPVYNGTSLWTGTLKLAQWFLWTPPVSVATMHLESHFSGGKHTIIQKSKKALLLLPFVFQSLELVFMCCLVK